jgi:hypothetical protein
MSHVKQLKKLLSLVVKESSTEEKFLFDKSFYSGAIPEELIGQATLDDEPTSLMLLGQEADLFSGNRSSLPAGNRMRVSN